jgi:DHA3 family tetracycline resistance protein-like MFS transporter
MAANAARPDRHLAAGTIYLIMSGAFGLFFALISTVNMIYQFEVAGLNPLQLILVGTLLETVAFLCEVPTGIVADVYSRRLSMVIGHLLVGAGFAIEGLVPQFAVIMLCQVIWGVGITFTSGATDAWLADEVGEEAAAPLYLRGSQMTQIGSLVGTGVSVALASWFINLPIVVGGVAIIGLGLFLALFMPERGFTPAPQGDRNSYQKMAHTFLAGARVVRRSTILTTILIVIVIRGAGSEAIDRLWQAHFLENFVFPAVGNLKPIVWFGVIAAVAKLLSLASTELVKRRVDTSKHRAAAGAILALTAAQLVAVVGMGLATGFWLATVAYLAVSLCRVTSYPVYTAWINQGLEPETRATVLSMTAHIDALGQIVGGPPLGIVGTRYSLRAAIVAAGLLLLPALPLLAGSMGRSRGVGREVALAEE